MTKLTKEQIESNLEAYKHAMETEGSESLVEYREIPGWNSKNDNGVWNSKSDNGVFYTSSIYRLRPTPLEPKWRAWDCHSIPVGNLIKIKHNGLRSLITSAGSTNARVGETCYSYQDIFDKFEQLDGQPAGVKEEV